ncbi:MAG TPA: invasion associated locus B family protein [Xanthobacteraceae bacterium]|jgi:invasion protein IalB|nr:invasion associated locus B family protein [Xanthobacteraceae bacterium]
MKLRKGLSPAHPICRSALVVATALSLSAISASAQQPPAAPKPAAPAAKPAAAPKPAAPAAQKPAQAPAQPAQQQQQQAAPEQQPFPVVYSPWTKICGKDQQAGAKETCLTMKEARLETGQFVAGAALIEQEGEAKKLLRITLPLGMQLVQGTRLIVDKDPPIAGRYVTCLPNGCLADFEVAADFVTKMKKGQTLLLQGINLPGQAASYPLPLAEFAKANEGPPTDPKVLEEQQTKLRQELEARAKKAQEELQKRQGAAATPQ